MTEGYNIFASDLNTKCLIAMSRMIASFSK